MNFSTITISSKRSAATYCFPDSSPPSSSMSPGRLCNAVPSSSFLLTTKTLFCSILFFFFSSLCRLILHMILGQFEAGHTGCGLQYLSTQLQSTRFTHTHTHWFCSYLVLLQCVAAVSLWPIGKGLLFHSYTKHSEGEIMFFVPKKTYLQVYFPHLKRINVCINV